MAKRGTGFAKKFTADEAVQTDELTLALDERTPRAIPLKLAPLLEPYRKRGRLSLRVEQLPHRARLSNGKNNGDRSWSLRSDELEDLTYLPPSGLHEAHTLAIRIISLDGGDGATLAVLDYPISPGEAPIPNDGGAPPRVADLVENIELHRLHDELKKAKASLAAREIELAEASRPREPAKVEQPAQNIDAELAAARARWDIELHRLRNELTKAKASLAAREVELAEALRPREPAKVEQPAQNIEAELASARAQWDIELSERLSAMAAQAARALEESRTAWRTEEIASFARLEKRTQDRITQEREQWRQEADATLSKAEQIWRAGEAARFAEAQASWRQQIAQGSEHLRTLVDANQESALELRAARDELAKLKTTLADRDEAVARAHSALEGERQRWQHDAEASLSTAQQTWKTEEAVRLASAQAQWERQSAKALEDVRSQTEAARHQSGEAELRGARDELQKLKAALADREDALAQAQSSLGKEREYLRQEADAALSKARKEWASEEMARTAVAEAHWQQQSDRLLEKARAQAEVLSNQEGNLNRLRDELAALKASTADRDDALAQAQTAMEQTREQWRRETEDSLANATKTWRANEAARLAASETRGEARSTAAVAQVAAQLKQTEAALAFARAQAEKLRNREDELELRRVRHELAATKATLAERELELGQERHVATQERERSAREARGIVLRADNEWKSEVSDAGVKKREAQITRRLVRDVVLVASLALIGMLFYLRVDPITPVAAWMSPSSGGATVPAKPAPSVSPTVTARHLFTVIHGANVRSGPSKSSAVIAALPRDAQITQVERRGNWVLVQAAGETSKPGWVYASFLKEGTAEDKKPASPVRP